MSSPENNADAVNHPAGKTKGILLFLFFCSVMNEGMKDQTLQLLMPFSKTESTETTLTYILFCFKPKNTTVFSVYAPRPVQRTVCK